MSNYVQLPIAMRNYLVKLLGEDGEVENECISRDYNGLCKYEVQIVFPNGARTFFTIIDTGYIIEKREIIIRRIGSIEERNNEIQRLYKKESLTQTFIGKIFGLSQSTVSAIVRGKLAL